jgi:hypothetical protein
LTRRTLAFSDIFSPFEAWPSGFQTAARKGEKSTVRAPRFCVASGDRGTSNLLKNSATCLRQIHMAFKMQVGMNPASPVLEMADSAGHPRKVDSRKHRDTDIPRRHRRRDCQSMRATPAQSRAPRSQAASGKRAE